MIFKSASIVELILILMMLSNLLLLSSSRLAGFIQISVLQGLMIGVLTLIFHSGNLNIRFVVLAVGTVGLKVGLFPWLLLRAVRVANIKKEIEPLVGFSASTWVGVLIAILSIWLTSELPLLFLNVPPFVITVSFFTIFTGCFLMVSRTKAITQVISYLVLENGIYLFGIPFAGGTNLLVELGVLLDFTVAIFVMGIIMNHINREFNSLDVRQLSSLKDWEI